MTGAPPHTHSDARKRSTWRGRRDDNSIRQGARFQVAAQVGVAREGPWRGAAGHPEQERFLRAMARKVLPGIKVEAWLTKNCITTSDGDAPLSRELRAHGRVMVVANAQGKGVMASHAIGDEVARLVTDVVHSRL